MSQILEKLLYNVVGTVAVSGNKFRELLEDLIQNGPYTEDEGRRIVKQLSGELEDMGYAIKGKIKSGADQIMQDIQKPINEQLEKTLADIKSRLRALPYGDSIIK